MIQFPFQISKSIDFKHELQKFIAKIAIFIISIYMVYGIKRCHIAVRYILSDLFMEH